MDFPVLRCSNYIRSLQGNKTVAAPPQASYQPPAHNAPRHPPFTPSSPEHTLQQNGSSEVVHESPRSHGKHLPRRASHASFPTSSPPCSQAPTKSPQSPSPKLSRDTPTLSRTNFKEDTPNSVHSFSNSNARSDVPASRRADSSRNQHPCADRVPTGDRGWGSQQVSEDSTSSRSKQASTYMEWSQEETLDFEDGVWKCGQCNKTFLQRVMLQAHICSRMPHKPYQCGHCCLSFNHPNELRTHAVVHSGKKPFKCGYCARTFAGATTLNNHVRTHTGERPFTCEKCNKTFSQATQLSRHKKCVFECVEDK